MAEPGPPPAEEPAPEVPTQRGINLPGGRDAIRLLVKAVGMLPDAERDQVYVWLISRGLAVPQSATRVAGPLHDVGAQLLALQAAGVPGAQQAAQQVVPVRFAADQHAELRAWCAEHGFSMATVIRGLVARFLEGQLPASD
jgi:hypothetical protein